MSFKTLPFKNLNADAWRNLALAAVALLYVANFIALIIKVGVENGVGGDFFAYWSAGKTARIFGFSQIYDQEILGQVQFANIGLTVTPAEEFTPVLLPYLYLSIFLTPFYFLSFLSLAAGYWLWTILNFLALIIYLIFLIRDFSGGNISQTRRKIILLSLLLSFPVYVNFLNGQIELFNVICCGEFLRNAVNKKPVLSGIWLGGMLLKPQLLVLVILALLLMKNWKIIRGFVVSAVGIFAISVSLSGVEGSLELLNLWTGKSPMIVSFAPEDMANWRMLGVNFNNWTSTSLGWILTGIGVAATVMLCVILIRRQPVMGSNQWVTTLFAIFAASCLVSWHSHIHIGMVLLPFLLLAQFSRCPENPHRILNLFVFAFPVALMGGSVIKIILMALQLTPIDNLIDFLLGLAGIIVYITILVTIVKTKAPGNPLKVHLSERHLADR